MSNDEARELMESAWATRRSALAAEPAELPALIAKAREELTTAVALRRDEGEPVAIAQAVHLLANVELDVGNVELAQTLWEEAIGILRGTDDVLQLAHKVRHLGDLHRSCGRTAEAGVSYAEALALYREHDRPGSLDFANAVSRMADQKEREGDTGAALVLWRETRDLYAAVDVTPGVEQAEQHIARLTTA